MRRVWGLTLLVGAGVGLFLGPQRVLAQACKDEASMVGLALRKSIYAGAKDGR